MDKIAVLENQVMSYAWGSTSEIQILIDRRAAIGKPMAELWMGAHPKAPSRVWINGQWLPLNQVIADEPVAVLGRDAAQKFSSRLPFLFKVLAAERPLSIQVHPDAEQARNGFFRENVRNIPLDAGNRNYKDPNPKPEILCALTPFTLFKGFRKIDEMLALFQRLSSPTFSEGLGMLRTSPHTEGLRAFFSRLWYLKKETQATAIREAIQGARKNLNMDKAYEWVLRLHAAYPEDIGLLSPLLFNLETLSSGEAVYLPPGEPHAYLKGMGVELMGNSDNVLRAGLTPKHMDVPELMRVVRFTSGSIHKLTPSTLGPCRSIYPSPAAAFMLSYLSIHQGQKYTGAVQRSVEIWICIRGNAEIQDLVTRETLSIQKGRSFIVPAAVTGYEIRGDAELYMASVPVKD